MCKNILPVKSKLTVLKAWRRQDEETKVMIEAMRMITPLIEIPDHGDIQ